MKTLVIGSGGREHALALALSLDPGVSEIHAAPGNPGIGAVATLHDVDPMDGAAVTALAVELGIDLVIVGPEAPLVAGVADPVRADRGRQRGHGRTVHQVHVVQGGHGTDARVARGRVHLGHRRVAGERQGEGVLTTAGPDDEDLHGWTTTVCSRPGPTPTAQILAPEISSSAWT